MRLVNLKFLSFLFIAVSCNTPNVELNSNSTNHIAKLQIDSVTSPIIAINKKEKINPVDSFLLNPFDLQKFKHKVGQSNSGSCVQEKYYYKPDYEGMYYMFLIFSNLQGYIGKNKDSIIQMEDGLFIMTYKPFGKYQWAYYDPTEELIEVKAKFNNVDLPELAFVGLDTVEIKKNFGEVSFSKNNCLVYTYKDRALVLGISHGVVKWLKYIHLNTPLTKDSKFNKLYSE